MALFAVLASQDYPSLTAELQRLFPEDHLKVGPGQWLLSAPYTAKEISDSLGVTDGRTSNAIVIAIGAYYGRAPSDIWDWMRTKLQRVP